MSLCTLFNFQNNFLKRSVKNSANESDKHTKRQFNFSRNSFQISFFFPNCPIILFINNFYHSNWNYLPNLISFELKSHFIINSFLLRAIWMAFSCFISSKEEKFSPNHSRLSSRRSPFTKRSHFGWLSKAVFGPSQKRHNLCFLQLLCAAHPVSKSIIW